MNSRQLHYFAAIVDEGSVSRAARVLRVSQPALSQHIANLEEELAASLLIRTSRGVTATPAGEVLYLHARKIMAQLKQAADDVRLEADTPRGEVAIVLVPTLSHLIAPLLLERAEQLYPDVELRILEELGLEGLDLIESRRVDLGLLAFDNPLTTVETIPIFKEPLYFVERLEPGGQTRRSRKTIPFADVVARPLVLSQKRHAVRSMIENAAAERNLSINVRVETESSRLRRSYILSGIAAGVHPWSSLYSMWLDGQVSARKIVSPELLRTVSIAWPKNYPLNAAISAIRDLTVSLCRDLYKENVVRGKPLPTAGEHSVFHRN